MSVHFPVDTAQIVALFLESVFYGIYLATFVGCIKVLIWQNDWLKSFGQINKTMLFAALAMLVFGTLDLAFGLRNNIDAFIRFQGDPEEHFQDLSNWLNVMKMVCYVAQTFIGDAILIYRCFIVYGKNYWIVTLPSLLWLATSACGAMVCYLEVSIGTGALSQSRLKPFITSMLSLTLATTVITTSLIVRRIWKVESKISHFRSGDSSSPLNRVMRILVESGLIYTTTILILFGTYLANSNAILGISDSVVQIIGITFNLIIVNTDAARKSIGSQLDPSQAVVSANGTLPLHMLNIHTEVSVQRHPPDTASSLSASSKRHDALEKPNWSP
ncbi:hypothetical protein HGRIS_005522 [Hohenbuehelia grisea]|uniref:Uncharacterized protein n=1 Tax=Hohenbuehelia grisea TaxID=104357 RepID=A0ABR3JYJ6_9AGAR